MDNDNSVFIGNKPTTNYVLAVVTQFNKGSNEVIIKARGRAINRAVDVAEIVRHKFVRDLKVRDILIESESMKVEGRRNINVSCIEIYLEKVPMNETVNELATEAPVIPDTSVESEAAKETEEHPVDAEK